jgi:type IV secretory pathway TraG/TraD family ATPase VirD4
MHVVAPAAESTSVASLTAALVDEVVVAGRSQAMTAPGGRLDPVLRLVLDELPNICPLPKVDSYLSDGAGRGMQILWSAQARSQLDRQFGRERTTTIMGATSVMLYGGGLNDPELLKDVSSLLGHVSIRERLTSTDRFGYRSWGEMVVKVPAVDPSDIYSLAPFQAVMMTGGSTGSMVRLMPWWERRDAADIETAIKEARARCRI